MTAALSNHVFRGVEFLVSVVRSSREPGRVLISVSGPQGAGAENYAEDDDSAIFDETMDLLHEAESQLPRDEEPFDADPCVPRTF